MAKSKTRVQRKSLVIAAGKRSRFIAVGLLISLIFAGAVFATRGGLFARRTPRPGSGTPAPMATDPAHPSKEYIYAGGRLVATEEPTSGGGGCTLTSAPDLTTSVANGQVTL